MRARRQRHNLSQRLDNSVKLVAVVGAASRKAARAGAVQLRLTGRRPERRQFRYRQHSDQPGTVAANGAYLPSVGFSRTGLAHVDRRRAEEADLKSGRR